MTLHHGTVLSSGQILFMVILTLQWKCFSSLSPYRARSEDMADVEVSSSRSGWGLRVNGCSLSSHDPPCGTPHPFTQLATTMIPREKDIPHPASPTPDEGITLSVLNQRDASLIFHKVFPLGLYWAHWADLGWHLARVAPGRLVVLAVSVSGTLGLRQAARHLAELGSIFATHLPPTARWTWVFIKGGRTVSETAILQGNATQHAHLILPLSRMLVPGISDRKRWQYCAAHGVMGGLCDEFSPDALPLPPPPPVTHQAALARVPVVVTAGNRHQYLYHSLTTLLTAPGAQQDNIEVVLGDAPPSTTRLLELMNVTYTTLGLRSGRGNDRLFKYYRGVFRLVANKFPDVPVVIFLDEDIEVSPDFFSFMSQTLWLLEADPTLYCVNGHSAGGLRGLAFDNTRVFRGAVQVEWGYGVTLDFVREALTLWEDASTHNTAVYDFWLYMNVRKGRECVFPEVSRTQHFGMGVNTDPYRKEKGPLSMVLVKEAPVPLQYVERLQLSTWRHDLRRNIKAAIPLRGNPCRATFLPALPTSPHYVFYYRLDMLGDSTRRPDPYQYHQPSECLGLWSLSEQGQHQGVSIVPFARNATLYLVGVPYSHYSHLLPSTVPLWDVDALTDQEFGQMRNYTLARDLGNFVVANVNVTSGMVMEELSTV